MRAIWTILVLLLGPVAGALGGRRLRTVPSRWAIYIGNAVNLIVLGMITAAVDLSHSHRAFDLFLSVSRTRLVLIWSTATAALCIAVFAGTVSVRIILGRSPKPSVVALLPRQLSEKAGFILLCVLIAAVEEFIYRGFALSSLREWLRSDTAAAGLVSLSFALMHGLQDRIAIVAAFVQGIVLAVPVFVVHSLLPSMFGHFVVDVCAGLFLFGVLQRFRLVSQQT